MNKSGPLNGDNITDVEVKKILREWLNNNGYIAYSHEMLFSSGYADVVAWKNGKVYSFEIKQKGDNIAKGLKQLNDYSEGSHYCILVVDEIGRFQIRKFQDKGFGIWKRIENDFMSLHEPTQMEPISSKLKWTINKFERYYKKKMDIILSNQTQTKIDESKWKFNK